MGKVLFVIGTDTGVGKSVATALIGKISRYKGVSVALLKPLESGVCPLSGRGDAHLLWESSGGNGKVEEFYLHSFVPPVAPLVAARLAKITVPLDEVVGGIIERALEVDLLIVEGAGGVLSPIGEGNMGEGFFTIADVAKCCFMGGVSGGFLLVVGSKLGCINHAALTLEVLRNRDLLCLGYLFNELLNRAKKVDGEELEDGAVIAVSSQSVDLSLFSNRQLVQEVACRYGARELMYLPFISELEGIFSKDMCSIELINSGEGLWAELWDGG